MRLTVTIRSPRWRTDYLMDRLGGGRNLPNFENDINSISDANPEYEQILAQGVSEAEQSSPGMLEQIIITINSATESCGGGPGCIP